MTLETRLANINGALAQRDDENAPLSLRVLPEEIALALMAPDTDGRAVARLDSLWHRVAESTHLDVVLRSRESTPQLVHLRVQSADRDWKNHWARWSWPVRFVPDELGGDAASAQDVLLDDGEVSLLLLPNERREIQLSFDTPLDEARAGDYAVSVVLSRAQKPSRKSRISAPEEQHSDTGQGAAIVYDEQIKTVLVDENPISLEQVQATEAQEAALEHDATGAARALVSDAAHAAAEGEMARVPVLVKLRHPPPRWMKHLPGIYHSSPVDEIEREVFGYRETPFFERFLRGFEDSFLPLQVLVGNLEQFFGANSTPEDFLPWLATWADLVLDENWPQLKRRRLIRHAVELYRWRGTRRGLSEYLEIYCDVRPQIHDQPFSGMKLGVNTKLGRDTTIGHIAPHTFIITLGIERPESIHLPTVHQIIDSQKPAHTAYELRVVPTAPVAMREAERE